MGVYFVIRKMSLTFVWFVLTRQKTGLREYSQILNGYF